MSLKDTDKMRWKWGVIILFLPLFFSCATQNQINSLNLRIAQLESRLYYIEKHIDKSVNEKISSNVLKIRKNIADMKADLDSIREDINTVRGKTEENRALIKQIVESDLAKIDQISQQLDQISQRISKLEGQIRQVQDYLGLTERISQKTAEKSLAKKNTSQTKKDIYSNAYSLYKQGRYREAILGFKAFLKKYPKSTLSDNAWFWIGECYMGLKKYEKAILAYYEVIKKYPKGNKVPSAMLRLAQAFLKINDKTSAKVILRRLIKKYPRSNEAKIARKLLKRIK